MPLTSDQRKIEESLVAEKDWKYKGETRASMRPKDVLLGTEVEFDTALLNIPLTNEQNNEIFKYVVQRFKEKTFDNYEFKAVQRRTELELPVAEVCETNKEILNLYDKIENELKRITDLGNDGFV